MDDEGKNESIRGRWQLADQSAGEPRQRHHASVERFTHENHAISSCDPRYHHVHIGIIEANESLGLANREELQCLLRSAFIKT
jgi:hypothetical protein